MIRRILISACLLLGMTGFAMAQDSMKVLAEKLSKGIASFDYSFATTGSDTPFAGDGKAVVAGQCYRIEGNGLDIRCDGAVRYTADPAAGEMVIESADGQTLDFLSNPALLLSDIGSNFKVLNLSREGGREVYELSAVSEPSIKALTLILDKGLPVAAELHMKDGARVEFKVSNFFFTSSPSLWAFSQSELSNYPNITDLR